mmetsp:Transcript_23650/g.54991  ORF Transcript_23650/g.54991 Transcript_23650/m.54991 type:complete len:389 (-) Transcript_23650:448-1614(-)
MSCKSSLRAPMSHSSTALVRSQAHFPMARMAARRGSMASFPFSSLAWSCATSLGSAPISRTWSLPTLSSAKLERARAALSWVSTSLYSRQRTNSGTASISSSWGRASTSKTALARAWQAIPLTTSSSCFIRTKMLDRKLVSPCRITCRTFPCSPHALQFSRMLLPSLRSGSCGASSPSCIATSSPASILSWYSRYVLYATTYLSSTAKSWGTPSCSMKSTPDMKSKTSLPSATHALATTMSAGLERSEMPFFIPPRLPMVCLHGMSKAQFARAISASSCTRQFSELRQLLSASSPWFSRISVRLSLSNAETDSAKHALCRTLSLGARSVSGSAASISIRVTIPFIFRRSLRLPSCSIANATARAEFSCTSTLSDMSPQSIRTFMPWTL